MFVVDTVAVGRRAVALGQFIGTRTNFNERSGGLKSADDGEQERGTGGAGAGKVEAEETIHARVSETAEEILDFPKATARGAMRRKELPSVQGGGTIRVPRDAFEALL